MPVKSAVLAGLVLALFAPSAQAAPREVNVHFRGTVARGIPLDFGPTRPALRVKLGETRGIPYRLSNFSKAPLRLKAQLKVEPPEAALAFRVVGGFAQGPVVLAPGESKVVPLDFVVAPGLPTSAPELTVGFALSPEGAR